MTDPKNNPPAPQDAVADAHKPKLDANDILKQYEERKQEIENAVSDVVGEFATALACASRLTKNQTNLHPFSGDIAKIALLKIERWREMCARTLLPTASAPQAARADAQKPLAQIAIEKSQDIKSAAPEVTMEYLLAHTFVQNELEKQEWDKDEMQSIANIVAPLVVRQIQNAQQCRQIAALAVAASQPDIPDALLFTDDELREVDDALLNKAMDYDTSPRDIESLRAVVETARAKVIAEINRRNAQRSKK